MTKKRNVVLVLFFIFLISSCVTSDKSPTIVSGDIDEQLQHYLQVNKVESIIKPDTSPEKVELGKLIFFDKVLSGNKNISCATCHLPQAGTSDALPVSVGEGGKGAMEKRIPPKDENDKFVFVPRNSLDIFNRGDFQTMFWDGRVMVRKNGVFLAPVSGTPQMKNLEIWSPAKLVLPDNLDSALAAQAMFPPTSDTEMRGDPHENSIGKIDSWEWQDIWKGLINRLTEIEEYRELFKKAYPKVETEDLNFAHAANAIAAFEINAFTLTDAPFDRYLAGDKNALSVDEKKGAILFYGKAKCGNCHAGSLMTDQVFHNRVVPQVGPGKGNIPAGRIDGTWDTGRGGVTNFSEYFYSFRTPPLRNVAKTGPWMHDGIYTKLEDTVSHELNPIKSAKNYDPYKHLPKDIADLYRPEQLKTIMSFVDSNEIAPVQLSQSEMNDLMAFLHSLTSPSLEQLVKIVPKSVPSGLPVED